MQYTLAVNKARTSLHRKKRMRFVRRVLSFAADYNNFEKKCVRCEGSDGAARRTPITSLALLVFSVDRLRRG